MARFSQGIFKPKNLEKFIGKKYPTYRSSWELKVFHWLDRNTNVQKWASEPVKIPYVNPFTGKRSNYIPDIMVEYINNKNQRIIEMIEIKPYNQSVMEAAKNQKQRQVVELNHAKWASANQWCSDRGIRFRVMTDKDIFYKRSK